MKPLEPYTVKDVRPPDILEAINRVKNKYSDQLDGELALAASLKAMHEVSGKVKAFEHIFMELHSELSKLVLS